MSYTTGNGFRKPALFLPVVFFFLTLSIPAQELNCNVQIVTQQIQGTNKKIFETLQASIYEFMNNRSWTNHVYSYNERIECNIMINLTEQLSSDDFRGTIQVQSRRPVYNSTYNSVMLNIKDNDVRFRYVEFEPLEFNETSHGSNLTSLLAYYAYIIIGLDYDSFGFEGGTEYLQKAERIVINAQNAVEPGWKAYEGSNYRNRFWLIQNLLDENYSPVREFTYSYHRQGLDMLNDQAGEGRTNIASAFLLLQQVFRKKPDPYLYLIQVLFDAKSDEFINLFRAMESPPDERRRAHQILTEVDPANTSKYDRILNPESI